MSPKGLHPAKKLFLAASSLWVTEEHKILHTLGQASKPELACKIKCDIKHSLCFIPVLHPFALTFCVPFSRDAVRACAWPRPAQEVIKFRMRGVRPCNYSRASLWPREPIAALGQQGNHVVTHWSCCFQPSREIRAVQSRVRPPRAKYRVVQARLRPGDTCRGATGAAGGHGHALR